VRKITDTGTGLPIAITQTFTAISKYRQAQEFSLGGRRAEPEEHFKNEGISAKRRHAWAWRRRQCWQGESQCTEDQHVLACAMTVLRGRPGARKEK
jgi:hypothetical protein